MTENVLSRNLVLLGAGIDSCVQQKNTLSALILLYSAIDTIGWLDSEQPYATRTTFMSWVERYLLHAAALDCTALDLYAARCGLLHTFTSESKLASAGGARYICYAWGDAKIAEGREVISRMGKEACYVAVHFDDLREALLEGVAEFIRDLEADPERTSRVMTKAGKFFHPVGKDTVRQYLDVTKEGRSA